MNVLVYSGPEVIQSSFNHALSSLRYLLVPHYSVQPLSQNALISHPWSSSCLLLVFPRCRISVPPSANPVIQKYVDGGGAYLGLGFGARLSNAGIELGIPNIGALNTTRDLLRFFIAPANSYVYPNASGADDTTLSLIQLLSHDGLSVHGICQFGGNPLTGVDAHGSHPTVSTLATYSDESQTKVAGIKCDVGHGRIALWSASIEYPLPEALAASLAPTPEKNRDHEEMRLSLLKKTLLQLGLQVPSSDDYTALRPLPQFLTSCPTKPLIVSRILHLLAPASHSSQLVDFDDANDRFRFCPLSGSEDILLGARSHSNLPASLEESPRKIVILCLDGKLPNPDQTPLFNLNTYYHTLAEARSKFGCIDTQESWGIGEALLYGETVTSTQTMLDKNPRLLSALPTPFLSLASYQIAGRGRGTNVWISPAGCLQFSLLLRVSLSSFPANKLVFIQYLFGLAVVEACRDDKVLGKRGKFVRLKWPNDIYAVAGDSINHTKKVGGILVNTSFSGGNVDIVIGCGLNVCNAPPITSLSQLLSDPNPNISLERTAAAIMARFETMWVVFVRERGSFEPFIELYLDRWLHSDQVVTVTTTSPPTVVRIAGITLDHGLLRTIPEGKEISSRGNGFIDLQPDGNSFDLMAGLVKSKS